MSIKESLAIHATYHKNRRYTNQDMVLVKVRHLHDDGTTSSEIKKYKNPKRPIFVSKEKYKYKVKPEYALISQCHKIMTTESNMLAAAKKGLSYESESYKAVKMKDINNSPNLFWSSLSVGSIILHHLRNKGGMNSTGILPTVGAFDFEWDVDTKDVSIGSYCFENNSTIIINREAFAKTDLVSEEKFIEDYKRGFKQYIQPILDEYYSRPKVKKSGQKVRKFIPEIVFSDNQFTTMRDTFTQGRNDEVDFFTAWNGHSDISVAKKVAEEYAVPMADIFTGDEVDADYRNAYFKEGQKGSKKDANGGNKSVNLQDEWHELLSTTGYQYVDMMGTYHRNRIHLPNAPSASLDWAMHKELNFGKFEHDCGVNPDDKKAWHVTMARYHLVMYALYASLDTIGLVVLEDKNFEIGSTYFSGVGYSPYSEFVRNPMRLSTNMHFASLEDGQVICGVGSNMSSEIDSAIVPSRNITVTLNPSYNSGMAMPILSDSDDLVAIVSSAADGDLTSSYPSNQILSNGSRGTTRTEYCGFNSLSNLKGNSIGYTLTSGSHNNHTVAQVLLGLPSCGELIKRKALETK